MGKAGAGAHPPDRKMQTSPGRSHPRPSQASTASTVPPPPPRNFFYKATNEFNDLMTSFEENDPVRARMTRGLDGSALLNRGGTGASVKRGHSNIHRQSLREWEWFLNQVTQTWAEDKALAEVRALTEAEGHWTESLCNSEKAP